MLLRLLIVAFIAGGLLFSRAAADAQQPRERGQSVAPAPAADSARVMPDVKYGPHQRNVMDVWLARSEKPTPVLVSIHGGGFRSGNKSVEPALRDRCLAAGISVVAITYRLSQDAIAPASFHDSARAIQFIRHNATEWNLDPKRIAATGGSAGAGLSLWLGFHDDLANKASADRVLRQSSRLSGMVVHEAQSSYDPRVIRDLFPGTETYKHPALSLLYDVDLERLDNLTAEKYKLFEEVSPINHLTKDDPPAMLIYGNRLDAQITNQEIGAHHPKFGALLKEKMDALGIRCEVYAAGEKLGGGQTTTPFAFLKQVLGVQ
jgi:acetyl esterase/lipase